MTDDMLALLAAFLFSALQAQPATRPRDRPAQPSLGTGGISGQITEQDTGRPFPRASVHLLSWDKPRGVTTEADGEGRYTFTELPAGEYSVFAGPGEHRSTHLHNAFGQSAPIDLGSVPRGGITLKEGESRRDVNVALSRAFAIEGKVVDEYGEPMAEVTLSVERPDGKPVSTYPGHTDDRGEYRIYGLAPGRYRVCARPQRVREGSTETSRYVQTCHPGSPGPASAADVIITAEVATGIDIQVQRGQTFTLSGVVIDATGLPADGGWISAGDLGDRNRSGSSPVERGRFAMSGMFPGRYLLRASIGGQDNPSDTRPPAREREVGFTPVDVSGSDVTGITVVLAKATKLSGRVVFEGKPPPLDRLRMVVQMGAPGLPSMSFMDAPPPSAAVENNLGFELSGVYSLPMMMSISGLPEGWALKSIRFDGRDVTGMLTDFSVPGAKSPELVLTDRIARAEVRVTEDGTKPAALYAVAVLRADPARWGHTIGSALQAPSKDGLSKLSPLPAGEYLIAAIPMEESFMLMNDSQRIVELAAVATRVTLTENQIQTINLPLVRLPPRR